MAALSCACGAARPSLPLPSRPYAAVRRSPPPASVPWGRRQRAAARAPAGGGADERTPTRGWAAAACSASSLFPSLGRVGWHRREGNASLLSFGGGGGRSAAAAAAAAGEDAAAQALSGLLPFVVAATAVAALANPATFSWVSKEYYAPALGGIMLSIGIKLSVDDFALAFKRPLPLSVGFLAQYMLKPLLAF
uniref:Uncharacterized protein n=1 Tax=Ananas comosus var. bracteatus TaxID=296719 RepID=A0A6V7Q0H7_ANACO|nr:unnamed protein product [Ananas comosus var. bracteatus]